MKEPLTKCCSCGMTKPTRGKCATCQLFQRK